MQFRVTEPDRPLPPEYEWLVCPHTGILEGLNVWFPERGGPQVVTSGMRETNVETLLDEETPGLTAGGKGRTAGEALRTTVGEAAERYCRRWASEAELRWQTYRELSRREHVPPFEYFTVFTDDEQAVNTPDRDTELPWTAGTNLLTGEQMWVPAEHVWSSHGPLSDERCFVGTSSGSAAGETLSDAILGGLYELIERDGFTRTWHTETSPPRVSPEEAPEVRALQSELFGMETFTPVVFEFDAAVEVPTYGAALVNEDEEFPKFLLGGGAHVTPLEAVEDALLEVGQGWMSVHESKAEPETATLSSDDWIGNFDDNVILYAKPDQFHAVSYLTDGPPVGLEKTPTEPDEFSAVLDALAAADCTPIAVDITTPDIGATGIRVASVIVPELLPLTPPSLVPSNHPAAASLSLKDRPHPFP